MLMLVDGYNVTMRDASSASISKEAQREALLRRLRAHASSLAPGGRVVVVFDAHAQLGVSSEGDGQVSARFAADADDEIVRLCGSAGGQVSVVTDDMRLRARISQDVGRHVRFLDTATVSHAALSSRVRKAAAPRVARDVGLPSGANEITRELKDLWLSEEDE